MPRSFLLHAPTNYDNHHQFGHQRSINSCTRRRKTWQSSTTGNNHRPKIFVHVRGPSTIVGHRPNIWPPTEYLYTLERHSIPKIFVATTRLNADTKYHQHFIRSIIWRDGRGRSEKSPDRVGDRGRFHPLHPPHITNLQIWGSWYSVEVHVLLILFICYPLRLPSCPILSAPPPPHALFAVAGDIVRCTKCVCINAVVWCKHKKKKIKRKTWNKKIF